MSQIQLNIIVSSTCFFVLHLVKYIASLLYILLNTTQYEAVEAVEFRPMLAVSLNTFLGKDTLLSIFKLNSLFSRTVVITA